MSDFNIQKLKFLCQKVLPLVYDDSLSYYETLCKLTKTLNVVIDNINQLPEYIGKLISDEKLKEIMSTLFNKLEEQIASANEGTSKTATAPRNDGDLVWLDGMLYRITHDMIAGDQYVVGSNCAKVTIEEQIKNIYYADEELLSINGIIDGTDITTSGDTHTYISKIKIDNVMANVRDTIAQTLCTNLREDLTSEISNRQQADESEATARENADNTLQEQITDLQTIYTSAYIEKFGGKKDDPTFDNKTAYENAIANGITEIKLQAGTYYFSDIKLYSGISIKGDGQYKTFIMPLSTSTATNFIYLNDGPIAYCHFSDFCVQGNGISGQNGWGLIGIASGSANDGGMWYSNFENIITYDFLGHQMYMYNNNDQTIPNQFIIFNNCRFWGSTNSLDAVYINTGNQITFIGGQITLYDISKTSSDYYALYCKGDIVLIKTAIEYCCNGIAMAGETYLTYISPWFEGIRNVIKQVETGAYNSHLNIYGGEFRGISVTTEVFLNILQRFTANINGLSFLGSKITTGVIYGAGNEMGVKFDGCSGLEATTFVSGSVTKAVSDNAITIDNVSVPISLINGGTLKNIYGAKNTNYSWGNFKSYITVISDVTIDHTGNINTIHDTLTGGKSYVAEYIPEVNTWLIY